MFFALIDGVVDPYGYFGAPRVERFNALKPAAANKVRVVKPHVIIRVHPKTIILGNSRPEMGLDPSSAHWPAAMRPVYNLAIPGDSVPAQAGHATEALIATDASTLVWAVDFLDFIQDTSIPLAPAAPSPAENGAQDRLTGMGTTSLLALLSTQALTDSVWTVLAQFNADSPTRTELGFNPARDYLQVIANQGAFILFEQKRHYLNNQLGHSRWRLFDADRATSAEFAAFEGVLKLCAARNVRLIVLINPYHTEYLRIIDRHGYAGMMQTWKMAITDMVARYPQAQLWDFSEPHAYLNEPAPDPDSRRPLRWFWEPSHYRRELGEIMLARILRPQIQANNAFGRRLVP